MTYRKVIFDWDGTLVDSVDHIAGSLQKAARDLDFPKRSLEELRHIVGLGMQEALARLYPGITPEEIQQLRKTYAGYFFSQETTPESLFPGVNELVGELASGDRRLAVATGKSRPGFDRGLASSGLGQYFQHTRCADETASKPDPRMLSELLEVSGIKPSEAIMIGDTIYDLEMASRIGMPAIGVTWGVHDADALKVWRPIEIVERVQDLHDILSA